MNISLKNLPKSELLITVEVPADLFEKYELEATKIISEKVEVPGFRKGQAPKAFVIAQIGPDAFFQEVLNIALPRSYFEAVKDKNLQVISRPDVKIISKSPLTYEAKVGIFPEITLKDVESIKIKKEPITVSEKEIDEVVDEMRKYRATFKDIDRAVKKGDRVEIDFQGYDEGGAALDKTKSTNHPLVIGEGNLIPGFEDELVGMKVSEKKKFPLKFPKDFHYEPLKSKTVTFEVELKRAEEVILPELNEEFVDQMMGEKKAIPEFKSAIKGDIMNRKEISARKTRENELLEKFLKEAKFDVPPCLIEEEVDYMVADFARELEGKGLKFDTYIEKMKAEKKDIRKEYEPEAEKRIRIRLILNYLFRSLNIKAQEDEMKKAGERMLERTPEAEKKKVEASLASKGEVSLRLQNNIMLEKLFSKFLD